MFDNPTSPLDEARRQIQICNACRYCEGYCAVFPAITRGLDFPDGEITHLANLCHNCRGCYYACQYTEPHEFALNIPQILAETRQQSWEEHAVPPRFAELFRKSGTVIAAGLLLGFAFIFWLASAMRPDSGEGFYAYMSHGLMVAIFAPAFLLPLAAIGVSLRRYWRSIGGGALTMEAIRQGLHDAMKLTNLNGGGGGCNFEEGDRFTKKRKMYHHFALYGFLLCFASTSTGTIMHYALGMEAPYGLFSLPKLFGIPGGILLAVGTAGLGYLKTKADPQLGTPNLWGGEMAFIGLLFFVATSGLALYAATGTGLVPTLLALHLGSVLTLFLLLPYSKMVHGFYRLAALIHEAQMRR